MELISAKCPDCGAGLKIPEGSSSVVCEFCGSQVMVTDVLGTGAVMQNCMILAYAALKDENYEEARDHFNRALEIDMKSSTAWFGRAICTGTLCKVAKPAFDDMIGMFETAIKYSPADKQENVKKNAASEVVKAILHIIPNVKMGMDLLEMTMDDKDADMIASNADITANIKKTKDEMNRALKKAQEYDPSNDDIKPLITKVNATARTEQLPGINQQVYQNFSQAKTEDPKKYFDEAGKILSQIPDSPTNAQPTVTAKKSGCMGVLVVLALAVAAVVGALRIIIQ